jgi:hypothetical protein
MKNEPNFYALKETKSCPTMMTNPGNNNKISTLHCISLSSSCSSASIDGTMMNTRGIPFETASMIPPVGANNVPWNFISGITGAHTIQQEMMTSSKPSSMPLPMRQQQQQQQQQPYNTQYFRQQQQQLRYLSTGLLPIRTASMMLHFDNQDGDYKHCSSNKINDDDDDDDDDDGSHSDFFEGRRFFFVDDDGK